MCFKENDRVVIKPLAYGFMGLKGRIKHIRRGGIEYLYEVWFDFPIRIVGQGTILGNYFKTHELSLLEEKERVFNFVFDPYGEENW